MTLRRGRTLTSSAIGDALAAHSDASLGALLARAEARGTSIGGSAFALLVAGQKVFVKRLTLTDRDLAVRNGGSTRDLHGLPAAYHYGVGSAGVSAWRELAGHVLTDAWVRGGHCDAFPLLHHWRVLDVPDGRPDEPHAGRDTEEAIRFWDESSAVRERLLALEAGSAGLYLFMEQFPATLDDWLTSKLADGAEALDAVCEWVADSLIATASFMSSQGLLHLDPHFRNILTDGARLYFSDFGLALSQDFDMDDDERAFAGRHAQHDVAYVVREFVNWLVEAFSEERGTWEDATARNELVRRYGNGERPLALTPNAAAVVHRFAPVAVVLNDFYFAMQRTTRKTPFPVHELALACKSAGLS